MPRFSNTLGGDMEIESTAYTQVDLQNFYDELFDHERHALADRLEQVSARLAKVGPRIKPGRDGREWSDHQVLAHIAGLSTFYGVIMHPISSGKVTEADFPGGTTLRDAAPDQLS